ncbi:MAG: tRNA(Ile)-lysidine synthase [Acidimicrobiaceae bacterium]|nr:tilS [Pseudonocardiales bacterium]
MGPHPAIAEVRRAVRGALRGSDAAVLVACSGGADSLALAAATAFEAPRAGVRAGLVTVDHGLQPGSAERAAGVAALGYELGLDPVETIVVTVGASGGPEAAARSARYEALGRAATAFGARALLGHTLDDQAETVLLGLGRGSGPRSIAGMRAVDGTYLRPFLGLRRATTEAACAALGLTPWRDPHNTDPSFQRARLRAEVLPLLEDVLQGGVAEALARTAALLRDDVDALDQLAAASVLGPAGGRGHGALALDGLADLPRAIRTRVLREWARSNGAAHLTAEHTAALDALVCDWHGQGAIDLPGGRTVTRASGTLAVRPPTSEPQEQARE